MKIYRNFEEFLTPYILSFSKIKIKHIFYKLESLYLYYYIQQIYKNQEIIYRFFEVTTLKVAGLEISLFVEIKCNISRGIVKFN